MTNMPVDLVSYSSEGGAAGAEPMMFTAHTPFSLGLYTGWAGMFTFLTSCYSHGITAFL